MDFSNRFVGKIPTGTVLPFTFFVLLGSVWQSRQSAFANFGARDCVGAKVVTARKKQRHSITSALLVFAGANRAIGSFRLSPPGSRSAGVAVIAFAINFIARVFELLTVGRELIEFSSAALGQDRMARVAVVGLDNLLSIRRLVVAIMTAETTSPVLVANVVRIDRPVGLHFREKVV